MDIRTFRAKTMRQALDLVHQELGPEASVLHTHQSNRGWVGRWLFGQEYEIAASATVNVPSRFVQPQLETVVTPDAQDTNPLSHTDYAAKYRNYLQREVVGQIDT